MSEESVQSEAAPTEAVVEAAAEESQAAEQSTEQAEAPVQEERPDLSRQFRAIAEKERDLRRREGSIKALEARIAELEGGTSQLTEIQSLAKDNPAQLLDRLGIDYDVLTQQIINEGNPTPEQTLSRENDALKKRLEKLEAIHEQREAEATRRKHEGARNQLIDNIKKFVDDSGDYELVAHNNAFDLVAEVMQQHYIATKDPVTGRGEILEFSKAAQAVENHIESEAERYVSSKKIQNKIRERLNLSEDSQANTESGQEAEPMSPKTLTNTHAAQSTDRDVGLLSRQESLKRMAQILGGG